MLIFIIFRNKFRLGEKMAINWKRVIIAGIVFVIIAQIVHTGFAFLSMDYYLDETYFPVWSKIMMPGPGPPPAEFMYYSIFFGLIGGILFALVYAVIGIHSPGNTVANKGLMYGFLIFLVAGIPGALSMFLLINLPAMLIVTWAIENLIIYLIGGVVTAKLVK